jgi:hypothetical protein
VSHELNQVVGSVMDDEFSTNLAFELSMPVMAIKSCNLSIFKSPLHLECLLVACWSSRAGLLVLDIHDDLLNSWLEDEMTHESTNNTLSSLRHGTCIDPFLLLH